MIRVSYQGVCIEVPIPPEMVSAVYSDRVARDWAGFFAGLTAMVLAILKGFLPTSTGG